VNVEAIATLVAVFLGWGLGEWSRSRADRKNAENSLRVARAACIDRLERIRDASDEQRKDEKYHLGADINVYRNCIASAHAEASGDWQAFERLRTVLRGEADQVHELIEELQRLAR
jgi:hypothetical protein